MSNFDKDQRTQSDNIWITAHTRMQAEKRYKRYSLASHLLLSYYAFLMILLSVFSDFIKTSIPLSQINIALAIAVFSASLIVYGFKFGETAQLHRECYLRLQKLLALVDSEPEMIAQYHEIIEGYPNHSAHDFDDLVIERTLIKNDILRNSNGPIQWTVLMLVRKSFHWLIYWLAIAFLTVFPVYILFFLGWQS